MGYENVKNDWRQGRLVYQVFVDRFAKARNSKQISGQEESPSLYCVPRTSKQWNQSPKRGEFLSQFGVWSHELEFWGGNLRGVTEKLDYLKNLGVEIIYLTPIFEAVTNHRYDTCNYFKIDPLLGNHEDLKTLCNEARARGLRIILDGVFNHIGSRSDWFQSAKNDGNSPYKNFFEFSTNFKNGYRAWKGVANLPELCLENSETQKAIFQNKNSVIKHYLDQGIDGWRLDVAHDIGPTLLQKITTSAHRTARYSLIIGETWNYPLKWTGAEKVPAMDAVINFFFRGLILSLCKQELSANQFIKAVGETINECGIDAIRRSWLVLDNHDTPRLPNVLQNQKVRQLARVLQFTLPGCPQLYYGDEVDMAGADDPENRAPMPWDELENNKDHFLHRLIQLYRASPALRWGDCKFFIGEQLLVFGRGSENFEQMRIVVINPSSKQREETIVIPDYRISHHGWTEDTFTSKRYQFETASMHLSLEPYEFLVLKPLLSEGEYFPYRRL